MVAPESCGSLVNSSNRMSEAKEEEKFKQGRMEDSWCCMLYFTLD